MWLIHACLSSLSAPCQPRTGGQAAQYLAAVVALFTAIVAGWAGLFAFLHWLDRHL